MFRWILIGLALFQMLYFSSVGAHHERETSGYCTRIESFSDDHVIRQSKKQKVYVTEWCFSKIRCTDYKYETVYFNTTIRVNKTRLVWDCCSGFKKVNGTCQPICRLACGHGECVAPDKCLCEHGWKDPLCMTECDDNTYGRGCQDNCTCFNGAKCDKQTGFCYCRKGYTGEFCEHPCPENTYGVNCKQTCLCENDAICDRENGSCQCQEGYFGKYCEKKCEDFTHGKDCKHECVCIQENTEVCHHIDGKCLCKVGYKGVYCEKQCGNFTYGRGCSAICKCMHADFCDPFNGKCICNPGWTGLKCNERCPDGYFGNECKFTCDYCLNISASCDPETGFCNCPAGTFGELCEKKCAKGYWGVNCSKICACGKGSSCDPVRGECLCDTAMNGGVCTENCATRPYDELCASECGCNCNVSTGICDEQSIYEMSYVSSSNPQNMAYVILTLVGLTLLCLVSFISFCIIKRERLLKYFQSRNNGSSTECLPNSHFVNPLYGEQETSSETCSKDDVVLDLNPAGSIARYFKNKINTEEIIEEKPRAKSLTANNLVKQDEEERQRRPESENLVSKRTSFLNDLSAPFKPITAPNRNSTSKFDPSYPSTDNLGKDFTTEVLGEFNIPENI